MTRLQFPGRYPSPGAADGIVLGLGGLGTCPVPAVLEPEVWGDEGGVVGGGSVEMRVHFEVGSGLSAEDVHFVLVQTFVGAELELSGSFLDVDVGYGVPDVAAPVAGLVSFEGGPAGLREA